MTPDQLDKILKSVQSRATANRWGIGTAAQYMASIEPCFAGGGLCPTDIFKSASPAAWTKALAEAQSKLTYCDSEMLVLPGWFVRGVKSVDGAIGGTSVSSEPLTAGSILDFDGVLTSRRKDRDGDILETSGARLDERMPLLFNHVAMMPIGKLVRVIAKDDQRALCKWAIADTKTGHDMATLIEFGVFRMSHGFKPYKFAPLAESDKSLGDGRPDGWHIKDFEIFEGSLVPVPANTDGIITASSRGKLHDPLVEAWAKGISDARRVQVAGTDIGTKGGTNHDCTCGAHGGVGAQHSGKQTFPAGRKDVSEVASVGTIDNAAPVTTSAAVHAKPAPGASDQAKPSNAVVSLQCPNCQYFFDLTGVPDGVDLAKTECPMCGYSMANTAGEPVIDPNSGAPGQGNTAGGVSDSAINSVNANTTLANANGRQAQPPKSGSRGGFIVTVRPAGTKTPTGTKQGRVLSSANKDQLTVSHGHIKDAMKSMKLAHGAVSSVLDAASDDQDLDLTYDDNDSIGGKNPGDKNAFITHSKAASKKFLGPNGGRHFEGSFEWLHSHLAESVAYFLNAKGEDVPMYADCHIIATYPDYAVVCVCDGWNSTLDAPNKRCYLINWKMGDGGPQWDGDPREAEVTAQAVEKALAGRTIETLPATLLAKAVHDGKRLPALKQATIKLQTGIEAIELSEQEQELETALAGL